MRLIALLLLLINVLAFAYWEMFAPPPPPEEVYISQYLPKGVAKLSLLSEQEQTTPAIAVAETNDASTATQPEKVNEVATQPQAEALETTENSHAGMVASAEPLAEPTSSAQQTVPTKASAIITADAENLNKINGESSNSAASPENAAQTATEIATNPDNPTPLPTSEANLPTTVAHSFARLVDFRITQVKKLDSEAGSKTLLSANTLPHQFLSGSDAADDPTTSATAQAAPALPTAQFQPVSQGSSILQVPPAIANLGLTTGALTPATTTSQTNSNTALTQPANTTAAQVSNNLSNKSSPNKAASASTTKATQSGAKKLLSSDTNKQSMTNNKTVCFRSGFFSQQTSAELALSWLHKNNVKASLKSEVKQEKIATWLYLPPFNTRALARLAEQELARRGVRDYYLVTTPPWDNAIALGLFTQDDSVTRRLAELQRKGYYNVRVQHRYKDNSRYWLDLNLLESRRGILKSFVNEFKVLMPQQISCK